MKMGVHQNSLLASAEDANQVIWANLATDGSMDWLSDMTDKASDKHQSGRSVEQMIELAKHCLKDNIKGSAAPCQHVVIMSNGGFSGIHQKLISALQEDI